MNGMECKMKTFNCHAVHLKIDARNTMIKLLNELKSRIILERTLHTNWLEL